jgi:hypothetical protein
MTGMLAVQSGHMRGGDARLNRKVGSRDRLEVRKRKVY